MAEAETTTTTAKKPRDGATRCRFCRDRIGEVDYKDFASMARLVSSQGKIHSRRRSGTCAAHQRSLQRAVKRARFVALIPYAG